MKRPYDQEVVDIDNEQVAYFVGTEVECTPQQGKKTLFVVGVQDVEEVMQIAELQGCKHIYLGANMSFETNEAYDGMIFPLLKEGYWVTLDFDKIGRAHV